LSTTTVHTLNCPRCGQQVTVTEQAPHAFTCTWCLAPIINPHAAPDAPRPVIPLEQQVSGDTKATGGFAVLVCLAVVIGVILIGTRHGSFGTISLLLVLAVAVFVVVWIFRLREPNADHPAQLAPPGLVEFPATLDYQPPPAYRQRTPQPTNYLAATGGFFLAIGICAACFFFLAWSFDYSSSRRSHRILPLLLVIACLTLAVVSLPKLGRRPGWSGFNSAIIIGFVLGMLALGPCGFCYLMFALD
jgi:hypothetical protein